MQSTPGQQPRPEAKAEPANCDFIHRLTGSALTCYLLKYPLKYLLKYLLK